MAEPDTLRWFRRRLIAKMPPNQKALAQMEARQAVNAERKKAGKARTSRQVVGF